MKNLITTILLLFLSIPMMAQERIVEQVDENLYTYKYVNENGKVAQSGYYKIVDGVFRAHGFWRDEYGTKAEFNKGQLVWIKPKDEKKYTFEEIQLHKLRSRIARLEERISSL